MPLSRSVSLRRPGACTSGTRASAISSDLDPLEENLRHVRRGGGEGAAALSHQPVQLDLLEGADQHPPDERDLEIRADAPLRDTALEQAIHRGGVLTQHFTNWLSVKSC